MSAYELFFKSVLKHSDTELAHSAAKRIVQAAGVVRPGVRADATLRTKAMGREFPTPFGIAAGFDKNAQMVIGLGALGFGHVEVGTVTPRPQPGNPRPRQFRLVADRSLINRMGFNNEGLEAVAARLERVRRERRRPVVGVNIGKNKTTREESAAADYAVCAARLAPVADYLAVNVSSPNTPGLRGLQDVERLEPILAGVLEQAGSTPVLVKIAPDLDDDAVADIAALVSRLGLAGVIATNTTISRKGLVTDAQRLDEIGAGGLSGPPLRRRSLDVLRLLREVLPNDTTVISVGGVQGGLDVHERLMAGANLVQGFTEFIYSGPAWAQRVNKDLAALRAA
ncbi:MAG TPA: quinone-dependent dihydroorotate dehydrogenase [Candidatus Agrococcus pullicola]|uniref:Dihydroorotate dehydrogenase (quinone) n=1 Tax=Candidatus Agrococcus pullicola TaxID=2838429 RepID=A0A9D2C9C3_9MICO|nr:quinone-dependent dihydroorotate dehydrogenase [Candidatus Agrococcus pullicola]